MRARLAALLPLLAAACATTPAARGLLRIDLAGPDAGPASPLEVRLVEAVRDGAAAEGLACRPGPAAALLRCSAATVGNQAHGLTVELERSGSGYAVRVDQPVRLVGMSSPVCAAQARLASRIAAELSPPVVRVDARSGCK